MAAEPFGKTLSAARVADIIGQGLRRADPALELDTCPIGDLPKDFDTRMRRARAVVIAAAHLDRRTLMRRGALVEIATRARQSGVPCCAITGRDGLDLFEQRILDLQVVLEAPSERTLSKAAGELWTYLE